MGEPRTVGGYKFKDWDKPYGSNAISGCGGKNALGAAQEWAKKNGRGVPTGINTDRDANALIDNCNAYQDSKKEDEPKKDKPKKDKTPDNSPSDPLTEDYVGRDADGNYLTKEEYDFYREDYFTNLDAALQDSRDIRIGNQSIAIQSLQNAAQDNLNNANIAQNTYSEDAETYRSTFANTLNYNLGIYQADTDSYTTLAQQTIKGEYDIDLAEIMKAGNLEAQRIQGEYMAAGEQIRGETSKAVEAMRTEASKYNADRNKEASIFGSFVGGFW